MKIEVFISGTAIARSLRYAIRLVMAGAARLVPSCQLSSTRSVACRRVLSGKAGEALSTQQRNEAPWVRFAVDKDEAIIRTETIQNGGP